MTHLSLCDRVLHITDMVKVQTVFCQFTAYISRRPYGICMTPPCICTVVMPCIPMALSAELNGFPLGFIDLTGIGFATEFVRARAGIIRLLADSARRRIYWDRTGEWVHLDLNNRIEWRPAQIIKVCTRR